MTLDPAVLTLLRHVPEFADRYLQLVEDADGDPGSPAAFADLAEYVAELADRAGRGRSILERCLVAIEEVATSAPDAGALVGWAFLDSLSPEEAAALRPSMGPGTQRLLDRLDCDDEDEDDEHEGGEGGHGRPGEGTHRIA
ncbi:MAG TPA: hypothetical protein VMU09_11415 [Acidimicrobiales bacterium]|nr:hypothetical protein [Acidimicrobiales bacterium]